MVGGYVCTSLVFVEAVLVLMLPCKANTRLILHRQGSHLPSVVSSRRLLLAALWSHSLGRPGEERGRRGGWSTSLAVASHTPGNSV